MTTALTIGLAALCIALLALFFPLAFRKLWGCPPLPSGPLRDRLETMCQRLQFKHADILIWPALQQAFTAAILGVVGRWRYVVFSETLLNHLSAEEMEAVLAHEIGHSKHRHLLFYPLLILGLLVLLGLSNFAIQELLPFTPLLLIMLQLAIAILYIRLLFGLFSRRFERQADLYVLEVEIPAASMIRALDKAAKLSGNIHRQSSWHHYSVSQRIHLLHKADHNPILILEHTKHVRCAVVVYLIALLLAITLLVFLALH